MNGYVNLWECTVLGEWVLSTCSVLSKGSMDVNPNCLPAILAIVSVIGL